MGDNKVVLPAFNKDAEFLLKEYETLRAEINTRLASQTQLTSVAMILLGGITAVTPLIIGQDSQGLHLRIPLIYLAFALLIIATLFTSLQWASMGHDLQIAYIGRYFYQHVRTKTYLLAETGTQVLNWEDYRNSLLYPKLSKPSQLIARLIVATLSSAQYLLILIPAIISLLASGLIYFINFAVPSKDTIGWFFIGFFTLQFFYLFSIIPCAIYISRVYEEISH